MRIDRELLRLFVRDMRIRAVADETELTDEELVEEIANFLETTPRAIDLNYKKPKLFSNNKNQTDE
jgi:hypothetical protein